MKLPLRIAGVNFLLGIGALFFPIHAFAAPEDTINSDICDMRDAITVKPETLTLTPPPGLSPETLH